MYLHTVSIQNLTLDPDSSPALRSRRESGSLISTTRGGELCFFDVRRMIKGILHVLSLEIKYGAKEFNLGEAFLGVWSPRVPWGVQLHP